jgi:hypothetical protein
MDDRPVRALDKVCFIFFLLHKEYLKIRQQMTLTELRANLFPFLTIKPTRCTNFSNLLLE